jgi:hypothetical protein
LRLGSFAIGIISVFPAYGSSLALLWRTFIGSSVDASRQLLLLSRESRSDYKASGRRRLDACLRAPKALTDADISFDDAGISAAAASNADESSGCTGGIGIPSAPPG